ncbi:rhodanese-like domain-containing protein [Haloparvum alkalitolerans]|uniref:rhodanese-like domain-containing protein n=1 Tax=Haloparvum alkalitolerans TaxID=1042953 RepID=UPI003CEB784C
MDGEIDPDELAALLDASAEGNSSDADPTPDGLRIVDIRQPRSFERGHIPGSENLPFTELSARVEALSGADRVVTVCPHGVSSKQAARLIGSYAGTADARVESLRGGLEAYEREYGLETPDTDPAAEPDEGPEAPF